MFAWRFINYNINNKLGFYNACLIRKEKEAFWNVNYYIILQIF